MNKYKNFRRYQRGVRPSRVKDAGHKFYVNAPEEAAAQVLHANSRTFSKRGYPDLTVYNEDGTIYGFIEVKPNDERNLKKEQEVFGEFCRSRGIPFIRWCPEDGPEKIEQFLRKS